MNREIRRSEIAAEAWRQRYVRGVCELDEMEAGVGRALAGECSDREWLDLAQERRWMTSHAGLRQPQSLATVDSVLKSMYAGPIR